MSKLKKLFYHYILRRNYGWYCGPKYTVTVPPGKWKIGTKITIKKNGRTKMSPPQITPRRQG